MAYPIDLYTPERLYNLLARKEFAQLRANHNVLKKPQNRSFLDDAFLAENNLVLHPNQQIVRNILSPETHEHRILVNQGTGAGKTALAIATAMEYIRLYQQMYNVSARNAQSSQAAHVPSVYIIGFSKNTFLRELLRRPEFGFVNKQELKELQRLREIAERGSPHDQEAVNEFESRLRRRLGKRQRGGFFRFFGYKEFYNKLFHFNVSIDNSNTSSKQAPRLDEEGFLQGLKAGRIQLNLELIDSMRNSLIICDEIHNVYNSAEINNYGLALRFALNMYDVPDRMAAYVKMSDERLQSYRTGVLKLIMMSATIINNSPAELVDHLNLLVPTRRIAEVLESFKITAERAASIPRLERADFFIDVRNLKPGALALIGRLTQGLVSFMRDNNPKYYPERVIDGEVITIPDHLLGTRIKEYKEKTVPYLRFIRCPMSELHMTTYQAAVAETGTLPPDGQALTDIVLPMPPSVSGPPKLEATKKEIVNTVDVVEDSAPAETPKTGSKESSQTKTSQTKTSQTKTQTTQIGIFRSRDIKFYYSHASTKWTDKVGITVNNGDLFGDAFTLGRIGEYSTKYRQMIVDLHKNIYGDKGKIFISHQQVHMSGVKLIEEILRRNGMVDETSSPAAETMCARCGVPMKDHESRKSRAKNAPQTGNHAYTPARFVTVHGEIDDSTKIRSLDRFRSQDNLFGYNYRVLIGSRVMNESTDLVACENEWIMHAPDDIPTLLQIFGRIIRKGSHQALPVARRVVHIRVYVSSLSLWGEGKASKSLKEPKIDLSDLSYEEYRYHEKLQDYLVIQEIERIFNENAIDLPIQYNSIFPDPSKAAKAKPELGTLYYKPAKVHERTLQLYTSPNLANKVQTGTFTPYYSEEELERQIYMIKRLFAEQSPALSYDELWEKMRQPPFDVQFNPKLLNEGIFRLALERLVKGPGHMIAPNLGVGGQSAEAVQARFNISRYFDSRDPYIITNGRDHQIIYTGKLYILVPVQNDSSHMTSDTHPFLGVNQRSLYGSPDTDIDCWYRSETAIANHPMRFTVTKILQNSYPNYAQMKYKFYQQYQDVAVTQIPTGVEMYDMTFHKQFMEDAVSYAFRVLTDEKQPLSELHDFYFKMLYVYDRLELIVFAEHVRDSPLWSMYSKYVIEDDSLLVVPGLNKTQLKELRDGIHYNAFMMSSIARSVGAEKGKPNKDDNLQNPQKHNIDRLANFLGQRQIQKTAQTRDERLAKFYAVVSKHARDKIRPVYAHMLPIGHLLEIENGRARPRLLDPDTLEYHEHPELSQSYEMPSVENSKMVGYYERMPTSLEVKFKLRPPIQKIERHKDNRMIETGSACSTRKKEELQTIMKNLGIKGVESDSIKDMCNTIKIFLMEQDMRELRRVHHLSAAERQKHPRVRWFYLHFEKQPNL
jgi:hypothetical protein